MIVEVQSSYKRRGWVCHFTFRLSWDAPLKDEDGEEYSASWHWGYFRWNGAGWVESCAPRERHSHPSYPPPREPFLAELLESLHGTEVEMRAIRAMEKAP